MPKAADHRLAWSGTDHTYHVQETRERTLLDILPESPAWFTWLDRVASFAFSGQRGHYTARKERRPRGAAYWYAYLGKGKQLTKKYLGKTSEVTVARLEQVAAELAGQAAPQELRAAPAAETEPPLLQTLEIPANTLPVQPTPFIGREQEVAAVAALLRREQVRLLTLCGPGGTGKTRLAVQVAAHLSDQFAHGVVFVNLAPIRDPAFVLSTIAQVLGLKETSAHSPLDLLQAALRDQQVLLVLDNFEQIVQAASEVAALLAACTKLKILVTSRMVLHVRAEQEFAVPPLSLPEPTAVPDLVALVQQEAVALFVARAQALQADFALTQTNTRAIAEICVRLDGLPLAIELAAVRIKLLPPEALLGRLAHRLEVLTGGARDLPERQQTLRNTFQWSYDLLTDQEQCLFRWLSVFVGGWTLEAAEAVCQLGSGPASSVLEDVASLLDKSLVQQPKRAGDAPRFGMLETLREFGWACLHEAGELEAARYRHARYYLELAEQLVPQLQGPSQATWLERLEQEHGNLRAALEWGLEAGAEPVTERRALALRLSAALEPFWVQHGHYREAHTFLERARAAGEGEGASLRARVLQATADLEIMRGDLTQTLLLSQDSLALYRELGDARGMATCLLTLGRVSWRAGKTTEAIAFTEEGVHLLRPIGEPGEVATALYFLALPINTHGEYSRGQAILEEAVQLFRAAGNELMVGGTLVQSAEWLCYSLADPGTIRQRLDEGQALIKKVGHRHWLGEYAYAAALVSWREGETEEAYQLIQESVAIFQEIDARWHLAVSLHILGRIEVQRGDLSAARRAHQESLALTEALGEKLIASLDLEGLAGVAATQGEPRWAAQLWGAAEALREAIAFPPFPMDRAGYEQAVRAARAHLGTPAFAAAWQEGRRMTPAQAFAAHGHPISPPSKPAPHAPAGLTSREVEVLRLVALGLTNPQIAEQLTISVHTVNAHMRSLFNKLEANSRNALTRFAIKHHLL